MIGRGIDVYLTLPPGVTTGPNFSTVRGFCGSVPARYLFRFITLPRVTDTVCVQGFVSVTVWLQVEMVVEQSVACQVRVMV